MKFTCLQENFTKGLGIVSKAISARAPLPILSNILIVAQDGRLKLTAFNGDTSISTFVGASVDEEGAITVPAKLIGEFVSNLSPSNIEGELKDSVLHLTTEKTKSKFNGVDASSYPELPEVKEGSKTVELEPRIFSDAILSVAFSAATDESRPILTGILLRYEEGNLTAVSADGFRLSEKVVPLESKIKKFEAVIPAKTLVEVARVFGSSEEPIQMVLSQEENLVVFESGEVTISTRIINGDFPDYKKLIPEETKHKAEFSAESLLEAVRLTNVFAKGKDILSPINLGLDSEGLIRLTSASQESGETKNEIEATIEGGDLETVFNSKYLLDFLNNIKAERLVLLSNGGLTPGVLRPANEDDYTHLIMPIRNQS